MCLVCVCEDGKTALINATISQRRETILFLISEGADVNMTDSDNKTALSHALDIHKKTTQGLEFLSSDWKDYSFLVTSTHNNIRRRIPDILKLLKIIQILVENESYARDVDLTSKKVLDLAMQGDKQLAVLEYFRMVSQEYYENAELRARIKKNLKENCSWYELKKLCQYK